MHLHRGDHDLGKGTIEYVVTGTAVRLPDSAGSSWPVLTDLSVQDYWRLRSAGYSPVGLLATTAVVFASPSRFTRLRRAADDAPQPGARGAEPRVPRRARSRSRIVSCARSFDAHGDGAVGVEFSHSVRREKFALGLVAHLGDPAGWQRGRLGMPYFVSGQGRRRT